MMYDLQELEAFVSVVRTGSLTASTRDLGLPKSTLSRRIRQLEDAVGQTLLLRQSRKIVPNDAGRVFYRYCNDILELVVQGREALDELKEEVTGKLELRCHESFVRGWFSGVVESFTSGHEDLQVAIYTQQMLPEAVEDGVCVWLGETGETELRQEVLGVLRQGIFGSPDYFRKQGIPASPGELARHPWVNLLGGGEGRQHGPQARPEGELPAVDAGPPVYGGSVQCPGRCHCCWPWSGAYADLAGGASAPGAPRQFPVMPPRLVWA